jgi:hypothetical protein
MEFDPVPFDEQGKFDEYAPDPDDFDNLETT